MHQILKVYARAPYSYTERTVRRNNTEFVDGRQYLRYHSVVPRMRT
jgi:hypothetical protein